MIGLSLYVYRCKELVLCNWPMQCKIHVDAENPAAPLFQLVLSSQFKVYFLDLSLTFCPCIVMWCDRTSPCNIPYGTIETSHHGYLVPFELNVLYQLISTNIGLWWYSNSNNMNCMYTPSWWVGLFITQYLLHLQVFRIYILCLPCSAV